jgi:hypothetical protein
MGLFRREPRIRIQGTGGEMYKWPHQRLYERLRPPRTLDDAATKTSLGLHDVTTHPDARAYGIILDAEGRVIQSAAYDAEWKRIDSTWRTFSYGSGAPTPGGVEATLRDGEWDGVFVDRVVHDREETT